jgi:UDP-N-acetylmuramoyl-L-alanyl-D-glutamate--2,6-diaminopimelate ligase
MRLSALLQAAGVQPAEPAGADPVIEGVQLDSRRVQGGDLFFALPGFRMNGERFVPEAVERGARAIVASSARPNSLAPGIAWVRVDEPRRVAAVVSRECYGRPDESLMLVGITGTNGKTTVAYLVESIARAAGLRAGRIGTVGYALGDVVYAAARTTPEAPDLYRLLAEMRERSIELVALEVSSHALALGRVEGARFSVAAFLNLGRDHLDFHRDEDAYFAAKARLFEALGPAQTAVLPADDPRGGSLAARTRARVLRFGRTAGAHVRMRDERCSLGGSAVVLETEAGPLEVQTSLAGRFNLDNVAAAAACALAGNIPPEAIPAGVLAVRGVPGRVERVDRGQPFAVLVDYAHTPDALARLLAGIRELIAGRLIVAFGCGGDRDRGKRPEMGRVAARGADLMLLTSDNPRSEDPLAILEDIERGVRSVAGAADRCRAVPDRTEAVALAVRAARPGDAVVVAGKGHESTQTVGERVEPLDDRELALRALAQLGWR